MIDLEKINRSVKKFSLIGGDSQPGSYDNFRDVLLRWAGQLRRAGLAYEINFIQPGKSNYRLRSNKEFEGNEIEKQITFPPPEINPESGH